MSKRFGINTKSAEARARKDAVKQAKEDERQQRLEDEYWRDDDKHVQRKQQRKDERDQKEVEKLRRKQENQKLLEQEEAALTATKSKKTSDLAPRKVTQAEIQERQVANVTDEPKRNNLNEDNIPIEENVNRLRIDGASARNIDDAIQVLQSTQSSADSHPEKRMKTAYEAFEKVNLPRLKQEHPTLRLSQLKQLLKKEWMKSPDNPFNKPIKAYNEGSNLKQTMPNEENESDEDEN